MGIIRIFLALSIVFGHSPSGIPAIHMVLDPPLAVECFFIISGFYVAMIYNEHYGRYSQPKRYFYKARYLRLYPSYIICAALMLASLMIKDLPYRAEGGFVFISSWSEFTALFSHMHWIPRLYQIISNLTLFGYDWADFMEVDPQTGHTHWSYIWHERERFLRWMLVPQAWTLGVELGFYLLAPWIARASLPVLVALVASACTYKYQLYTHDMMQDPLRCTFFPAEIGVFSLGVLMYRIYKRFQSFFTSRPFYYSAACVAGFILMGYGFRDIHWVEPNPKYALYLFFLAFIIPIVFGCSKRLKWDRAIGDLSYPIYICHSLIDYHLMGTGQYRGIYTAVISIACAALLVRYVENPINGLRKKPPAGDVVIHPSLVPSDIAESNQTLIKNCLPQATS